MKTTLGYFGFSSSSFSDGKFKLNKGEKNSMKVIFYTIGCSQCNALKTKLDKEQIKYETENNMDKVIAAGFKTAPVLEVVDEAGNSQFYTFIDAVKWVNEHSNRVR